MHNRQKSYKKCIFEVIFVWFSNICWFFGNSALIDCFIFLLRWLSGTGSQKKGDNPKKITEHQVTSLQSFLCQGLGLWCSTPLSTIFQLYRGSQQYFRYIVAVNNISVISWQSTIFQLYRGSQFYWWSIS